MFNFKKDFNVKNLQVGQTVCVFEVYSSYLMNTVREMTVTSIGRKYIGVGRDMRFLIDTGREKKLNLEIFIGTKDEFQQYFSLLRETKQQADRLKEIIDGADNGQLLEIKDILSNLLNTYHGTE